VPVANIAIASLSRRCPGYLQALLVITVAVERAAKRGLVVQLVALDAQQQLRALDPPMELVEAAATIADDARWWKLTARITPKPDGGATLHVDVL
jgi:hypothetical protein